MIALNCPDVAVCAAAGAAAASAAPAAAAPVVLFAVLLLLELALLEGNSGIVVRHRLPLTGILCAGAGVLLAGRRAGPAP